MDIATGAGLFKLKLVNAIIVEILKVLPKPFESH